MMLLEVVASDVKLGGMPCQPKTCMKWTQDELRKEYDEYKKAATTNAKTKATKNTHIKMLNKKKK